MFRKIFVFARCIYGEFLKFFIRLNLLSIPYGLNDGADRKEKVIVSLTSYGRRVSKILPYTIVSLLRQTYKPDMIILWLDSDNWNENNLPDKLFRLKDKGLTIKYCKDIKSYKKLIPALEMFPNDIIITCDDDIYYKKNMIERLVFAYSKNPNRIYSHRAHKPILDRNENLKSYKDWDIETTDIDNIHIFPTGVGGCLYKRSLLYEDVCREDLFMKLAPNADDVWFYFMEVLKGTPRIVLPFQGAAFYPLDFFYQYFHTNASLYASNCNQSQNDVQIRAIMKYYNLKPMDLMNA